MEHFPLFTSSCEPALSALPTRAACCAVFTACMQRHAEVDDAAAERGAALLSKQVAAQPADGLHVLKQLLLEVFEGAGRAALCGKAVNDGALQQREALVLLLQHSMACGGLLLSAVSHAAAGHSARLGADFENICPTVLCGGARSVRQLVALIALPPAAASPSASPSSGLLLDSCKVVLGSCAEHKERLRAVACCAQVWACAACKWPEELTECAAEHAEDAMDLAAEVVNSIVHTSLYDTVGKLRCAATTVLLTLAPALKPQEVLKLATLKIRDKDTATRRQAMRVMAALVPSVDGGSGGAGDGSGLGSQLTPEQLQTLVLHGSDGVAATEDSKALAKASFWGHIIKHQERVGEALAQLRVLEQRGLYEPLLMGGHIEETFAVAFPGEEDDDEMTGVEPWVERSRVEEVGEGPTAENTDEDDDVDDIEEHHDVEEIEEDA